MIKFLKFFVASLIVAFVMALLEIQIEGSNGWATNLPTWKVSNINILNFIGYKDKPITGYHIYLWLYSFLLLHASFFFSKWSLKKEFYLISFYIFFTTLEGILWFILNPSFGISSFLNSDITWYNESRILYLPIEYWMRFFFGFLFYWLATKNYAKKVKK